MSKQRVVVTGATGLIGRAVVLALLDRGDEVVALARGPERAREILGDTVEIHAWPDPTHAPPPVGSLTRADAVIHLLGEPVAQRWNPDVKRAIRDSRELGTQMLVSGLRALPDGERPRTLVSASAVGVYGSRGEEPLDEQADPGSDFLAEVVVAWEREAARAEGIARVVMTRTGIVLSPQGGALSPMLRVFRLGLGGPIAGGRQYVSWIHIEDAVRGLLFCLDSEEARGPVNLVSPHPVTNAELTRSLGQAVHRPAVLPVPSFGLRLLFGEMADGVIGGQRVVPARLRELGFDFSHPEIGPALTSLLAKP